MKPKQKKLTKPLLSDKIADALTVKPRADIEDDQVFGTKPKTVTRADISSSDSEDDAVNISDFRKRNVNLLSEISKKYEGEVVLRKEAKQSDKEVSDEASDSDDESYLLSAKDLFLDDVSYSSDGDEAPKQNEPEKKVKPASDTKDFSDSESIDNNITTFPKNDVESEKDNDDDKDDEPEKNQLVESASDSEDFSDSEGESDDYSITKFQNKDVESDKDDDDDDNEGEGYDISQLEEPVKEEFEHIKKQNISEEAKKGACVRNQLLIWEGLLEMRIHLQRCMNTANQMPMPETYQEMNEDNEFSEECNIAKTNITNVLEKLLMLQDLLFKNYPETKTLSTKKQENDQKKQEAKVESDEEIPSDTDNEEIPSDTDAEEEEKEVKFPKKDKQKNIIGKKRKLEDYEKEISTSHKVFKSFRDTTIQKWNDKTRLATAANIKSAPTNTVLQQISYILSDREKLVKRTQLKRTEYDIIGYKKPNANETTKENGSEAIPTVKDRKYDDVYISEIFDDSDFYHQLLRELIECKSADISDPVQLSRQWIALQQMRSKMKRKVDTKATKGRKIKYVVHNQLVNYMAPEKCTTWTDESTNELYSSLFGKLFEHNNVGLNANVENGFKLK